MEKMRAKIKRWGNSFGVVVPMEIVKKEDLKEGSDIEVTIQTSRKTRVKDIFGILKRRKKMETAELMREVDQALWPKDG